MKFSCDLLRLSNKKGMRASLIVFYKCAKNSKLLPISRSLLSMSLFFCNILKFITIESILPVEFNEYLTITKGDRGAEGIEAKNDGEIIIRDSEIDFAEAVVDLLFDEGKRKRIGENALKLVRNKYTWNKVAEKFEKEYKRLIEQRGNQI